MFFLKATLKALISAKPQLLAICATASLELTKRTVASLNLNRNTYSRKETPNWRLKNCDV